SETAIPEKLRRLQFVRFDTGLGVNRPLTQLAEALREDLDWIREHTRLGDLAARWQARGQPDSLLLRGGGLGAAQAWTKQRRAQAPEITEAQRVFLNASLEAETARSSAERKRLEERETLVRRNSLLVFAAGLLALVLMGGSIWQSFETERREINVMTSLAHQAYLTGRYDQGMRIAVQGLPHPGAMPWSLGWD